MQSNVRGETRCAEARWASRASFSATLLACNPSRARPDSRIARGVQHCENHDLLGLDAIEDAVRKP
jgi:hypothetical protein